MTKKEKKDKSTAMKALDIPVNRRSAFMRFANNWGRFNMYGDWKFYEYSPLEAEHKATKTMQQMWDFYLDAYVLK